MAFAAIISNKMRAFLTMLGIIIGIGAVIAIQTVGNSITSSVSDTMTSFGASNISVGVTQRSTEETKSDDGLVFEGPRRERQVGEREYITDDMIQAFQKEMASEIEYIQLSESLGNGTVTVGKNTAKISLTGGDAGYMKGQNFKMLAGTQFSKKALDGGKSVCMMSDYAVKKLYKTEDMEEALGKHIVAIVGQTFYDLYIVGVYKLSDTGSLFGGNADRQTDLYVPLSYAKSRSHINGYPTFTVVKSSESTTSSSDFRSQIQIFFDRYYHTNRNFEVTTSSLESMMEEMTSTLSSISIAISVIAGIALVVGGIGVMNIMLVSISERTREIGTRKALGATNGSIRLQFIIESMMLCIIGGIIGIILGISGGAFAAKAMDVSAKASITSIVLSVGFSMAIGLFFGYYPANKAAKMNPIDALTYE